MAQATRAKTVFGLRQCLRLHHLYSHLEIGESKSKRKRKVCVCIYDYVYALLIYDLIKLEA